MVNHRGPLPLKELHSTSETIMWRDPGGSWACLPPVYKCNRPATVCDTCGLCPKQHTKKRGDLGNTKNTKITRRTAGTWAEVYEKRPKRKHSELNEPYEMVNRAKPLRNNNSRAEEDQRKSPNVKHSNRKGALRKPLWEEQSPTQH